MNSTETLKEFYPTPPELIAKMLKGIRPKAELSVLEPSAGKGDIALFWALSVEYTGDYWRWKFKNPDHSLTKEEVISKIIEEDVVEAVKKGETPDLGSRNNIDCMEIEPILQDVIRGRDLRVVGFDFLRYNGDKRYDIILMNPPFSNGEDHLLHAIEIGEKFGSRIVCLLNAETIKNPFSNKRKLLVKKLEEYNADIEFIQDAFLNAERTTDVEIALIKIQCPKPVYDGSEIFERLKTKSEQANCQFDCQQLITGKEYEQEVIMYKTEIEVGKKIIENYAALSPYISSSFKDEHNPNAPEPVPLLQLCVAGKNYKDGFDFNDFVYAVRYKYWEKLLNSASFLKNLTADLKQEYRSRIKLYANYDFSLENIYEVAIQSVKDAVQGIEDKILSLFESFTYKYSTECSDNIHYFNGWKTNKSFVINQKVIVPCYTYDQYTKKFSYWRDQEKFVDIEKVFDNLLGVIGEENDVAERLTTYERNQINKNLNFRYFTVTFYKKGTAHITFTNDKALKMLNIFGCQKKGWLPPSYGTKSYDEMDAEEQSVIDEFEGQESYEKILADKSEYIISNSKNLLLLNQ